MRRNFKYLFVLSLVLVAVLVWYAVWFQNSEELKFYLLDVGQGDAIFIVTPTKNQILIDGGPDRAVLGELGKVMPFWDRSLDLVILTHPHLDHVGGLVEVLKNYEVARYLDAGDSYPLAEYQEIKKLVETKNISYHKARRGMKMILDEGTELNIFAPEKLQESKNPHRNMVVSRLSFGETDFLLMADAEKPEEFFLLENGDDIQSEVLKVGHHGSRTSSSLLFLEKVSPAYALISVGRKNQYGHPHPETIQNLEAARTKIFRTDVNSRIEAKNDGKSLRLPVLR